MSQCDRLLEHLKRGNPITRLEGWDRLGIIELPARICELRSKGHRIETIRVKVRNRFGEVVTIAKWYMEEPF